MRRTSPRPTSWSRRCTSWRLDGAAAAVRPAAVPLRAIPRATGGATAGSGGARASPAAARRAARARARARVRRRARVRALPGRRDERRRSRARPDGPVDRLGTRSGRTGADRGRRRHGRGDSCPGRHVRRGGPPLGALQRARPRRRAGRGPTGARARRRAALLRACPLGTRGVPGTSAGLRRALLDARARRLPDDAGHGRLRSRQRTSRSSRSTGAFTPRRSRPSHPRHSSSASLDARR